MNIWQNEGINKITRILQNYLNPEKIELKGSVLHPDTLDIFSDVDLDVFIEEVATIDYNEIIQILSAEICDVFGYEIHINDNHDVLRLCFENGWRFDITFNYHSKRTCTVDNSFNSVINRIVNEFWFMSVMVLIKIGRNDYLIAAHLALELCQLNIVMQMLERDKSKNTNIHRFGNNESVLLPSFAQMDFPLSCNDETVNDILQIVFQASERMDEIAAKYYEGYSARNYKLLKIYNDLNAKG